MKTLNFIKITAFLLASLVFITCKKKDVNPQTCKVVKMAMPVAGADTGFIYYTYDSSNRLIKSDFGSGLYTTYTFETNKVTSKSYVSSALSYTEVFTLNSEGIAISSTYAAAGAAVSKTVTYEYNADGFLITKTTTQVSNNSQSDTYSYEYENGNLSYETHDYSYGSYPSTDKTYEYFTDKTNTISVATSILGKKSANLLKKTVYTIFSATNIITNTNYTYEFGSDGKITKQIMAIGTASITSIPKYECN